MPRIVRRAPQPGTESWHWPPDLHPVLRQVLSRRALESPAELELSLKHLTPVGRFGQLDAAVSLLLEYRRRRIVVVGDFDADGATSTALMALTLGRLGFHDVRHFVPDRFELGYGLSPKVLARLAPLGPELIVTVDNGISSVDGVEAAREAGIAVLVTDHHAPPDVLPAADAIVNPNLPGDAFPGQHLAGVGVAFYLLAALGRALGQPAAVSEFLDLVALGTVADLVTLDRSNRILVSQGLARIRARRCRPGIEALALAAGVDPANAGAATLGFQIAPRLNAAGRLDDMSIGVRCLLTESAHEAWQLAAWLDRLNGERRELEARMKAEALALVEHADVELGGELPAVICLKRHDWHEGLVGLVASRIKDRHHRPAFAFAPAGEERLKGSGRSIAGFHLRDALAVVDARHPGLIERFGGHAMAAGLTLRAGNLDAFRAAIEAVAAVELDAASLAQEILTDGELSPEALDLETARALRAAGPWGQGFPAPCFDGRFVLVEQRLLKGAHLKMMLKPAAGGPTVEAIAFNHGKTHFDVGAGVRVAYRLEVNDYMDEPRAQLVIEHIEADSET